MKSHSEFQFSAKDKCSFEVQYPKKQEMNDDEIYSNTKKTTIRSFTDHISNQAIKMCTYTLYGERKIFIHKTDMLDFNHKYTHPNQWR